MRLCKAITRSGNRCNNRASPGSLACYRDAHIKQVEKNHKIFQWGISLWSRIPRWIKTTGFTFIISIIIAVYYGEITSSKYDLKSTEDRLIDVVTEKINRDHLEREYPYGYVLLHVDKETLKPVEREAIDLRPHKCDIDWFKSRVLRIGEKDVDILLPDMVICTPKRKIVFEGNVTTIKRIEGIKQGGLAILEGITFWIEVLINEENLLVLIVGFGPKI